MRYLKTMLALLALLAFAPVVHADDIDFVEGQKIPATLKADRTHSGAQTFSGANAVTGSVLFDGDALKITPPAAQTIGAGGTIAADACGTIKRITAAGGVTTDTTNTFTAPTSAPVGCCMDIVNIGAQTITLDTNALFISAGGANVGVTQLDSLRVCSDGAAWYQISALLSLN